MIREFLKAKIHRATVTDSHLDYDGSLSIDAGLMETAGIAPNERVHVYNITNGARFETYAIRGEKGSRCIELNGAAARTGHPGDRIIIVAYCLLTDAEIPTHTARIVTMQEDNVIGTIRDESCVDIG
ncbi:Aspartate 1-decarboxylase (EC [Olavius algarvensis associated proteobacterium Delta 3]|nr:Aspartate 1-decarboxylase (EC [Olavius algarvensis associated proteobacterium Delta 3]CAB5152904.1 Aspartate 1-decarboxylase (EC [Olavius algarvensis associated proteobacterium Delta 3]